MTLSKSDWIIVREPNESECAMLLSQGRNPSEYEIITQGGTVIARPIDKRLHTFIDALIAAVN